MESRAAGWTVKTAAPLITPLVAVIVGVPTAVAVARPPGATVAPAAELQTTVPVRL